MDGLLDWSEINENRGKHCLNRKLCYYGYSGGGGFTPNPETPIVQARMYEILDSLIRERNKMSEKAYKPTQTWQNEINELQRRLSSGRSLSASKAGDLIKKLRMAEKRKVPSNVVDGIKAEIAAVQSRISELKNMIATDVPSAERVNFLKSPENAAWLESNINYLQQIIPSSNEDLHGHQAFYKATKWNEEAEKVLNEAKEINKTYGDYEKEYLGSLTKYTPPPKVSNQAKDTSSQDYLRQYAYQPDDTIYVSGTTMKKSEQRDSSPYKSIAKNVAKKQSTAQPNLYTRMKMRQM